MIGTSTAEYIWVRTWVIILHAIAPLCVFYAVLLAFLPASLRLPWYFEYWAFAETVFYVLTYLYQRFHLQRPALHPPLPSEEERRKLFDLCQDSTQDHVRYISKWFLDVPLPSIKRENIKEFFRWAFLNTAMEDPTYDKEVEGYVTKLETGLGREFEPGRADVKCLRLTLDKVNALHRSLIWYICIFVVDSLTHAYMRFHNFHFYRSSIRHCIGVIPPRPHALLTSHHSPAKNLTYWYRPHTSHKELPVVFLHGIGVGLYPYMQFLKELNQGRREEDGQIGILAVEILPVSSRITSPPLRKEVLCQQIRVILQHHGIEKFVLVSHSYGSVITTHLLKTPDIARQISSVILVDPISILLHQPDVAYNFIFRRPKFANEWLVWYFGSKDMGVAHTLSRTFFWSEIILWKEDLIDHNATVFLGGKDTIINTPLVREYLESGAKEEPQTSKHTGSQHGAGEVKPVAKEIVPAAHAGDSRRLNVVWGADLDHGQIFDLADWRGRLKSEILKQARTEGMSR